MCVRRPDLPADHGVMQDVLMTAIDFVKDEK
jgi:hypothetical protein